MEPNSVRTKSARFFHKSPFRNGGFQQVGKIPPAPLFQSGEIYRVFVQTLNRLENPRAMAY